MTTPSHSGIYKHDKCPATSQPSHVPFLLAKSQQINPDELLEEKTLNNVGVKGASLNKFFASGELCNTGGATDSEPTKSVLP